MCNARDWTYMNSPGLENSNNDSHGWLFGAIQFEVRGNLHSPKLLLAYPRRSASGALLQPIVQTICCHWRNARYGGRYLIFSCSECHRPARVLYARHNSTHHQIWFSPAADALVSPISPPWAIAGTARRAVLKSCAADCSGTRAVPCQSSREACTRGPTTVCWGCLLTMRLYENRGRVTAENTDQINIVLTFGGNAETGSRVRVGGESPP